ncbi:MAG TPA: sulfur carrier protein ThiS [Nitrospiria bacterium]|jgi:thiamine biosynthesis protein ThiS|nr:sulfur carrier protein ThiS [Nitrospiria bacterium]
MPPVIQVLVNGERREFEKDTTVARLLEQLGSPPERVAVELNLRILDKQDFPLTVLNDGDRLEIINFVGGGV